MRTPELHADSVEAPYTHTPGLTVVVPSNAADAKGLLASAIRSDDPVLVFEPIPCYRTAGDVPDGEHLVPLGRANVVREATTRSSSPGARWSTSRWRRPTPRSTQRGAQVGVVDLRTLTPLDTETIVHAAERAGRVVVVHEAPLTAGFGAEVVATLQEEAFYSLEAPIRRVAGYDVGSPPPLVEDWCRPDVARVVAALDASLDA